MKKNWLSKLTDGMSTGATIAICFLVIVLAIGLVFGLLCLEAWFIMLLWNAVIPVIFVGMPTISFWLAFGLMLLCNLLFKSSHYSRGKD